VFVLVSEEQKPLAIGMGGRNVRLAAQIVGWEIELKTPAEYEAEILAEGGDPGPDQLEAMPEEAASEPTDSTEEEAAPKPTDSPAEDPASNQEDA
jgi:transcription antitermination factor NusA-like protein